MIDAIKNFFDTHLSVEEPDQRSQSLLPKADLASAALLIEVMNADHELSADETAEFLKVVKDCLEISDTDLKDIQRLAEEEAREATSLYEFTRLINDNYDYAQKCLLIENMWRVAFSDEKLDKYEEHLIRQITDLIYVSHSDFIRTKLKVRDSDQ
mgnify:CR=1 FL=1